MKNLYILLIGGVSVMFIIVSNFSRSAAGGLSSLYPDDQPSDGWMHQVQQQREIIDRLVKDVEGLTGKIERAADSSPKGEASNGNIDTVLTDITARLNQLEAKSVSSVSSENLQERTQPTASTTGQVEDATSQESKEEIKVIPFSRTLVENLDMRHTAKGTVVTAYFETASKHKVHEYLAWMSYMLSMGDPMIIFTTPEWADRIKGFRSHAVNRTIFITTELDELPMATNFSQSLWKNQFKIDPIARFRKSYKLYWIWLSKTHFLNEAVRLNPFESTHFVWTDIGCFRNEKVAETFANATMITHTERIPKDSMLFMAHAPPVAPADPWFSNSGGKEFFTSGSMMAGSKETVVRYHKLFLQTMQGFLDRDKFVGEDQILLQSTCLQHHICQYVLQNQLKPSDTSYFGLRTVLLFGGNHYKYWKPPNQTAIVT